ncbi:FAD/FMN-containing dehydrogenase [Sinorhizobium fredii]|uniref:FAD/FMN-containing dehydrogenase n=1 Tax=Rhizobium fredii TaxID=380 RepID=A0A2A6LPA4_RHIFR|nr:FAD-binding protein [Sinorhizobium fredii]PDT44513.1 FAD/FMN-containing dehydrogenase [Sinorhizobium fredii]
MLMRTNDSITDLAAAVISPTNEAEVAGFIAESYARATPMRVVGGGTRLQCGTVAANQTLTSRCLSGIVTYEPGALTLIARAGTPIHEIEATLASEGQTFAFEPMDHRAVLGVSGAPTLGGMVAGNVSGPRRVHAGACRDHLLGVRFVDGRGRIIKNGGRVMKNVTGLDLGKLLCGSHGTLGVLTEVALKTLPAAETQQTIAFRRISVADATEIFARALATPYEVSGAAFHSGTAWLRIEGFSAQVDYRRERLSTLFRNREFEIVGEADSQNLWRGLRDLHHFAASSEPLWRILVKPSEAPAVVAALHALGGEVSLDWAGGLIWFQGSASGSAIRGAAGRGQAMLVRRSALSAGGSFPPEEPAIAQLSGALRRTFDPAGILNPGLMDK